MRRLFHVKSILNNVGIRALMLEMDAGGNNNRLVSLLRHECKLGNKGWLGVNENLVSFKDPTADHDERQMRTYVVPCATHHQKSLRNSFHSISNRRDANRCFQSAEGHKFAWEDCFVPYCKRDLDNGDSVNKLNLHCIYLNSWNKMRVGCSL